MPAPQNIAGLQFGLTLELTQDVDADGNPLPDATWVWQSMIAGVGQEALDLCVLNYYANKRAMEWQPSIRDIKLIWSQPTMWEDWPEDELPPDPNPPQEQTDGQGVQE